MSDPSSPPVRSWLSLDETGFDPTEFSRLWFLATLTYGVGDIVTTLAVFRAGGVGEGNGLLRVATATFGQAGLVGVKLAAFGVCLGVSLWAAHADDRIGFYLPPAALAVVGAFTTAFNLRLLVG